MNTNAYSGAPLDSIQVHRSQLISRSGYGGGWRWNERCADLFQLVIRASVGTVPAVTHVSGILEDHQAVEHAKCMSSIEEWSETECSIRALPVSPRLSSFIIDTSSWWLGTLTIFVVSLWSIPLFLKELYDELRWNADWVNDTWSI